AGARRRPQKEAHTAREDKKGPDRANKLAPRARTKNRPQKGGPEPGAGEGGGARAEGREHEPHGQRRARHHRADDPRGHVRAEGVDVAVGQVHDAHDAVDEAEPARDQEEDRRVEQRVEQVDEEDVHYSVTRYEITFTSAFVELPLSSGASRIRYAPGGSLPLRSPISRPPSPSWARPVATTSSPAPTAVQQATTVSCAFSPVGARPIGSRTILYDRSNFVTVCASTCSSSRSPRRSIP